MTETTTLSTVLSTSLSAERRDLLEVLDEKRNFLRFAARGLTDEQALATPTASALCVGGLVKHVAAVEQGWATFMETGRSAMGDIPDDWQNMPAEVIEAYGNEFRLLDGETLESVLAGYEAIAAHTDRLIATLDLDQAYPLPTAPWFEPGASWTVRRTIAHIIGETAHHSGHADIIRETIDGQKTMSA